MSDAKEELTMSDSKEKLRREMLKQRASVAKQVVVAKSHLIWAKLKASDEYKTAKNIIFYISFGGEVYTHEMINSAKMDGKRIFVPFVDEEAKKIKAIEFPGWRNLSKNNIGILEPKVGFRRATPASKMDLVVVPGLAFESKGNRLGFGKGYYDKFLKEAKKAKKVGLAFEYQILKKVPNTSKDVKVGKVITEKMEIKC